MSFPEGEVVGIFGFGSFFRGEPYRDVDILVVVESDVLVLAALASSVIEKFKNLECAMEVKFDVKVFTRVEFSGRPLMNMGEIVEILPLTMHGKK